MNTEALIHRLASEAAAIRPMTHPLKRFLGWLLFVCVFVSASALVIALRSEERMSHFSPGAFVEIAIMLLLAASSALSALFLSVPDQRQRLFVIIPSVALLAWTLHLATAMTSASDLHLGAGLRCFRNIVLLSLPPAWALRHMLKNSASLAPRTMTALAILSGSALACALTRLVCPNHDPLHFFGWHYVPTLVLGVVGFLIGELSKPT